MSEHLLENRLDESYERIEELELKLAKAVAIAEDAIDTMVQGPFSPGDEGDRLRADLLELRTGGEV